MFSSNIVYMCCLYR